MDAEAVIARVRSLVASGASDDTVLMETVRLLQETQPGWDWVGIYLLIDDTLILGPYVGKPTDHVRIPVGTGVCGTAVAENTNIVVEDVRARENYLACSLETRSEIVVLIRDDAGIVGQFDIDSDRVGAFTARDEVLLTTLAPLVATHCRAVARHMVSVT
jgi:GAF domain-containing protein